MEQHPESLISPVRVLSDGRRIIEVDYAMASTFEHGPTNDAVHWGSQQGAVIEKLRRRVKDARIPDKDRTAAQELARGLVDDISATRPRLMGRKAEGRLDSRAFVRVVEDVRAGRFSADHTRPFRDLERVDRHDPPRIAIVADYCWALRDGKPEYERMVGTLSAAVLWACEAVDLPCTFAAVRGDFYREFTPGKPSSSIAVLARPGRPMTTAVYWCATSGDGSGDAFVYAHSYAGILPNAMNKGQLSPDGSPVPGSTSGAGGVRWARECEGATFVIGIGNFPNDDAADLWISPKATPADAIARLRVALKEQRIAA